MDFDYKSELQLLFGLLSNMIASLIRNNFPKRPSDAPLHTFLKAYDVPIGFVTPPPHLSQCIALLVVAECGCCSISDDLSCSYKCIIIWITMMYVYILNFVGVHVCELFLHELYIYSQKSIAPLTLIYLTYFKLPIIVYPRTHCVPRAPVCEVSSQFLPVNLSINTYHTRFYPQCTIYTELTKRVQGIIVDVFILKSEQNSATKNHSTKNHKKIIQIIINR